MCNQCNGKKGFRRLLVGLHPSGAKNEPSNVKIYACNTCPMAFTFEQLTKEEQKEISNG